MHDITEGGVLGAIWEASCATGKGVLVHKDLIPVERATFEISKVLNIDPYRLISSGSMLMIISGENLETLSTELKNEDIDFAVIGEVVESGTKIVIDGERTNIDPPGGDELYKVV